MAEVLVTSLLAKLGELAWFETHLQLGIGDDIKFIRDELSTMKAFLKDAEKRGPRGEVANKWVAQIRDEFFKLEDVLEEFLLQMKLLKSENSCVPRLFQKMLVCHQFRSEMENIRKEIEDISKRREQYNLQEEGTSSDHGEERREDRSAASPFVEEKDILGIDRNVKQLEEWLLQEEEVNQRKVISVVGMGGLGKTTLVKRVYKKVEACFDCFAWLNVSQTYEMKDILIRMLEEFYSSRKEPTPNAVETMNEDKLREKIHKYLQEKRYVLVLDDIWDIHVWEGLKHALPVAGFGKIVFTTRVENVAFPLDENCHVHKLGVLPHEIAWELFCRKAFHTITPQGKCPQYLHRFADAMLRKCNGLPLAVVALGSLMSKKGMPLIEWRNVLENLDWELNHNQDLEQLNRVLLTSYNHLPPQLKYCFLYCALFPENTEIEREKLIRLWVAEGLIEEHPRKTPEEVANDYFIQLIDRSMLQAIVSDFDGGCLKACKMHGLMRDVAIHMFEKEEFGMVITQQNNETERGCRRVAIHDTPAIEFSSTMSKWNIRSLLVFGKGEAALSSVNRIIWRGAKLLRVLDLEGVKIASLPEDVGDFIHLRYLGLKRTHIKELPASLQKLRVLETLDVRYTNLRSLPRGIIWLQQLRHLLFHSRRHSLPIPLGARSLKRLQTLHGMRTDKNTVRELGHLTQLRTLFIGEVGSGGEHSGELFQAIKKMKHLCCLTLTSSRDIKLELESLSPHPIYLEELTLEGRIEQSSMWFASLNCLRLLHLSHSKLKEDPLSTLCQLPNLDTLFLLDAYAGKRMGCSGTGCFRRLSKMVIVGLKELEEWSPIEQGTMQCLRSIVIATCPKLAKLPRGFQYLSALEKLELGEMLEEFVDRLRSDRAGEDRWMVQHIPNIKLVHVVNEELVSEVLS
ncbi:PREDICTED: disease resistance protein RPM1-like [Nelumbo nucifera]|nr:PREDICTED: disease resistance protein RPM1-like [Nelumbo nucifera]